MSDYPTETELEHIKNWTDIKSFHILLKEIAEIWEYKKWGFKKKGSTYWLATGGWSGNEDIVGALQENRMFWALCWQSSKRGGAYKFKVPKIK